MDNVLKLVDSIEKELERKALQKDLAQLQDEIGAEVKRVKDLEEKYKSESRDVAQLQMFSFKNLKATLTRTKEAQLSQEQAEQLFAQFKLEAAQETLEELRKEERRVKTAIYTLHECSNSQIEPDTLKQVRLTPDQKKLATKIEQHLNHRKLIDETIKNGRKTLISLDKIQTTLNQLSHLPARVHTYIDISLAEQSARAAMTGLELFNAGLKELRLNQISSLFIRQYKQLSHLLTKNSEHVKNIQALKKIKIDGQKGLDLILSTLKILETLRATAEAEFSKLEHKWNGLK